MATGWKLFDCRRMPQYGYGRLANVFTNLEFERLCNAAGPTNGKIVLRDGKTEPKAVAIIHCVGSRDRELQRLLLRDLLHGGLEVRAPGAGEDQGRGLHLLHRHADPGEGLRGVLPAASWKRACIFVRGKVAEVTDAARLPGEEGKLIVQVEDTLAGQAAPHPGRHGGLDRAGWSRSADAKELAQVRHLVQHGRLVHRDATPSSTRWPR